MNGEPKPFTIQPMLAFQGGHIKKTMLLPCDYVENTPFLSLKKSDRQLAAAMGKPVKKDHWAPLAACDVFEKMQQLRNCKVDQLIKAKMVSDDPLADAGEFTIQPSQRHRLFLECKIPEIIEIELPEFVTAAGKHVSSKQLKIITTWNKIMSPSMEATGPNMDWLLLACQHAGWLEKPTSPCKRKNIDDEMDLPELPQPLKYSMSDDGAVKIKLHYKSAKLKRWTCLQKTLDKDTLNDDDALEDKNQMILAEATKMMKIYNKRHVENANDDESSKQSDDESDSDEGDNKLVDAAGEGSAGSTGA